MTDLDIIEFHQRDYWYVYDHVLYTCFEEKQLQQYFDERVVQGLIYASKDKFRFCEVFSSNVTSDWQQDRHSTLLAIDTDEGIHLLDSARRISQTRTIMSDIHPKTPTELVAQVWCEPQHRHREMDAELAASFVRIVEKEHLHTDAWVEIAAQHSRNEDYYRGLCHKIGALIGKEAYTQDDSGIVDQVLCAKLPELVAKLVRTQDHE